MLIEEQIKIARLIASGTPREVAINEVAPTSSIENMLSKIFSILLLLTNSFRSDGVPFESIASL